MNTYKSVLLHNARVFDGIDGGVIDDGAAWVVGDEIKRVGPSDSFSDVGSDVQRIDVGGRFLMPGLVEAHSHLTYFDAKELSDLDIKGSPEAVTIKSVLNASKLLRAGYTSAVSFGSLHGIDVALAQHIEQGLIPGPRYRPCGRDITGTSGMVDWNPDYIKVGMEGLGIIADNPWAVRAAIRKMRKMGADTVKLYIDGENLTDQSLPGELAYTQEEVNAAADEARRHSMTPVVHARSADAVRISLEAGIRVIGHANYIDDTTLDMLHRLRHEVFVTPAVSWQTGLYENGSNFGLSRSYLDQLGYQEEIDQTVRSVRAMREKGIVILPGGDYGFAWTPHGTYAKDLQNFVDLFGFTPVEALLAATRDAGKLMDASGRVGTLQPGAYADLVIVDGDPLTDITVLQDQARIVAVMKGGDFVHLSSTNRSPGTDRVLIDDENRASNVLSEVGAL